MLAHGRRGAGLRLDGLATRPTARAVAAADRRRRRRRQADAGQRPGRRRGRRRPTARSPSTATPASAAWSTAATAATPTTGARPPTTRWSTGPTPSRSRSSRRGPLRARLAVTAAYRWPAGVEGRRRERRGRRTRCAPLLELRAGERSCGSRSRSTTAAATTACGPTSRCPAPADRSRAECAFADGRAGPRGRGRPHRGAAAHLPGPAVRAGRRPDRRARRRGRVRAGRHRGDGRAGELALTLLRCTGMLSQGPMATRPLPAGPLDAASRAPSSSGRSPAATRWPSAPSTPTRWPTTCSSRCWSTRRRGRPGRRRRRGGPRSGTGADRDRGRGVGGRARGRRPEVRVFNPAPTPATTCAIDGRRGWLVDLRGRPLEPFEGAFAAAPLGHRHPGPGRSPGTGRLDLLACRTSCGPRSLYSRIRTKFPTPAGRLVLRARGSGLVRSRGRPWRAPPRAGPAGARRSGSRRPWPGAARRAAPARCSSGSGGAWHAARSPGRRPAARRARDSPRSSRGRRSWSSGWRG